MGYDDDIWELVPDDPGPPPVHIARFVDGLPEVASALDLGCGDGRLTGRIRAGRVVAADTSAVALERAARRLPDVERILLEPDTALPFGDGAFDLVLCAETIEHVRDLQRLLSEVRRVLRPHGLLALTTPAHGRATAARALLTGFERVFPPLDPHLRFLTRRSLCRLLGEMGFRIERLERRRGSLLTLARR